MDIFDATGDGHRGVQNKRKAAMKGGDQAYLSMGFLRGRLGSSLAGYDGYDDAEGGSTI